MSDTNHHVLTGKLDITSNLLVGSSHLFVDTNNNRVGLVTTDPHAGLHVNSNAYVNTDLRVGPAGPNQVVINATAGRIKAASFEGDGSSLQNIPPGADGADGAAATIAVGTTTTGAAGTSASVTNSGTTSAAVFDFVIPRGEQGIAGTNGNDGTNYFTLSGSDISRLDGNVGIGKNPGVKLDVEGDVRTSGLLTVGNYASAPVTTLNGSIYYDTTVKTLKLYADNTWGSISGGSGGGTNYYLDRVYSSTYSTTANFPDLTHHRIIFQDEINISDSSLSSWYDTSSGIFTPLMTGWYLVNWSVSFDLNGGTGGSGECFSSLHKNNSYYSWGSNHKSYNQNGNQADIVSNGSCLVYLNGSTDYLHIEFFSNIGGSVGIINPGPSPMRFQVQKVSWYENGLQYSMSGNSIIFEANSLSPNQVISANTDTAIFKGTNQVNVNTDTGPFFDVSTGRYEPLLSGMYLVTWSVVTNTASGQFFTVLKKWNGSTLDEHTYGSAFNATATHYNCSTGSTLVKLNGTGDYIVLHFITKTNNINIFPSSSFPSRFTIFRMSDL